MISFDVLINPPSENTIYNLAIAKIVSLGLPIDKLSDRSVAKAIIRGLASTGATVASMVSTGIRGTFVGRDQNGDLLATGGYLTNRALFDFGVSRTEATFATGSVLLGNTGANSYHPMQPNTFIIKNSNGKAFWNTDAFNLDPGNSNVGANLIAIEQGTASNTGPSETWTIVAPADPKITISNPAAFVASDEQDDDDLTTACVQKIGSWSLLGPRDAYYTAIRVAVRDDNGLPVNVNRRQKTLVNSKGTVALYLASPTGPVDSHDIAGVQNSVELIARPDTVTVNVYSATAVPTSGTLTIWTKTTPGVTSSLIASAVNAMLAAEIAAYPIGGVKTTNPAQGYLYAETIEGWAQAAHPSIVKVDYTGADLPLNDGQVAQLTATLDIRFVQVT